VPIRKFNEGAVYRSWCNALKNCRQGSLRAGLAVLALRLPQTYARASAIFCNEFDASGF
jgi:hypothetical protein